MAKIWSSYITLHSWMSSCAMGWWLGNCAEHTCSVWTINKPHLPYKTGLDVMQSHPLCRTCFDQYQASSAAPGWLGDGDCYNIMRRMQSVMHAQIGASEAPRTHFRASKFPGSMPPTPLPQSLVLVPLLYLHALGPHNLLSSPVNSHWILKHLFHKLSRKKKILAL